MGFAPDAEGRRVAVDQLISSCKAYRSQLTTLSYIRAGEDAKIVKD